MGCLSETPALVHPEASRAACQRGTADASRQVVKTNGCADGIAAYWCAGRVFLGCFRLAYRLFTLGEAQ